MSTPSSKRSLGLFLPLALLALLVLLAWLQYRWTGALSRAEAERLRSGLSSTLARFRGELDFEIARVLRAFSVRSSSDLPEALEEFRRETSYPDIVSDLYRVSFDEGKLEVFKLEEDGSFARATTPPELLRFRRRAEGLRDHRRGRRGPWSLAVVSSDPLSIFAPSGYDPRSGGPEATLVVLRNDVLRDHLLPDVVARVFGSDGTLEFDVVVVNDAGETVFSSRNNASEVIRSADASSRLLSLRAVLGRPRPPPGHRPGSFTDESPRPPPPDRDEGPWTVFVRHRMGSLDAVVGRARVWNLALGSGVLLLLGTSVVLLTLSARRATELSARKMEFVAGVSHELRTPLAVIRSAAQNLADGSVSGPPQVRRYGGLIEAEGRRLQDLVEKVLELAGVESQTRRSPRERVSTAGVVAAAVADAAPEARERGIEIETALPEGELYVLGDAEALRRGVGNLVANAIKHGGEENSVKVRIEGLSGEVSISVADRGPGIPDSEVPHVFDAFYRGRRARERQIRGSGLGLSLVQQVAREHGGRVEVRSSPGKGSTFTIVLPEAPGEGLQA